MFPEEGYEAADDLWRKLDNVLVANGLITARQLTKGNTSSSNCKLLAGYTHGF